MIAPRDGETPPLHHRLEIAARDGETPPLHRWLEMAARDGETPPVDPEKGNFVGLCTHGGYGAMRTAISLNM